MSIFFKILVRIAIYGPQIDQSHGENRLSHITIWVIRKIKEPTYNSLPHTPKIGLILLLLLFVVYLAEPLVKMAPNKGTAESLWTMTDYRWPIDIAFSFSIYCKSAVRGE